MSINKLAHYSVRTTDTDASRRFYVEVMGCREAFRPPFQFPGLWVYKSGDESEYGVLHIIGIDAHDRAGLTAYLGDNEGRTLLGL